MAEILDLDLYANGISSLLEAIKDLEASRKEKRVDRLKFALLHSYHGFEMLLKAKIEEDDESRLWVRDKKGKRLDRTLSFGEALKVFGWQEVPSTKSLIKHRHNVQHYKIKADKKELELMLAQVLQLALWFLDMHMQRGENPTLAFLKDDKLQDFILQHREDLLPPPDDDNAGEDDRLYCSACGKFGITKCGEYRCDICGAEHEFEECTACETPIDMEDEGLDAMGRCESCSSLNDDD